MCEGAEEHETDFPSSGLDIARERIRVLTARDIELQVSLIRASLKVHQLSNQRVDPTKLPESIDSYPSSYLEYAVEIGNHLCRAAIWGCDGTVSWIGSAHVSETGRWKLGPIDASLYDGTLGIGVFLAALSFVCGDRMFYDSAVGALRHSLKYVDVNPSLGLGKGLASYIYALPLLCSFLRSEEWLCSGRNILASLLSRMQSADLGLDVLNGAAGVVLACSKWHQHTSDEIALEIAGMCERKILGRLGEFYRASNNGFAHGYTGVDAALRRINCAGRPPRERGPHYPIQHPPGKDARTFPKTWCNGAIGAAFGDLSNPTRCVEAAREFVEGEFFVDHVCCGLFGAVELLIESSHETRNSALMEQARNLVARRLKADTVRWVVMLGQKEALPQPGFFQGIAGIGYSLLRLDRASELPCILTFG